MNEPEAELKRLNVVVPPDLHDRLRRELPGRLKSEVVRHLLETFLNSVDEEGQPLIFALLRNEVKIVRENEDGSST